MNVRIEIIGDQVVQTKLRRLGSELYKLDSAFRQIGQYLANFYANEAFASQGQVFGGTWPRLSQDYSVWKAKHFPGRPPLVLTGTMKENFSFTAGSQSVVVGNDTTYFPYLEGGTSKMPARPMMGINSNNKRMISQILESEIRAKIAAA